MYNRSVAVIAEHDARTEIPNPRNIHFGIAASNVENANALNPSFILPEQLQALTDRLTDNHLGIELQLEGDLGGINTPDFAKPIFLGIHAPTRGIDLSATGKVGQYAIDKTMESLHLAHQMDADYAVLHLESGDKWHDLDGRSDRIQNGKDAFRQIVEEYKNRGYGFALLIENLEYPKYPATGAEIAKTADFIRELGRHADVRTLGIAFDASHLWRSGFLLDEKRWIGNASGIADEWTRREVPFSTYIEETLRQVRDVLKLVHITGAAGTDTHLLPGTYDRMNGDVPLARQYTQHEMDVHGVITVLFDQAAAMHSPLWIINESQGYTYEQMMQNCNAMEHLYGEQYN